MNIYGQSTQTINNIIQFSKKIESFILAEYSKTNMKNDEPYLNFI